MRWSDVKNDSSFTGFIRQNFEIDNLEFCGEATFLVRFKINETGSVTNLAFSKGVDSNIKKSLQRIISGTSGKWLPSIEHNIKVTSDYLVLGVNISLDKGCSQQMIDDYFDKIDSTMLEPLRGVYGADSLAKKEDPSMKKQKRTLSEYVIEKSARSLRNLFDFDDNANNSVWNCNIIGYLNFSTVH